VAQFENNSSLSVNPHRASGGIWRDEFLDEPMIRLELTLARFASALQKKLRDTPNECDGSTGRT
jgi:hypothetical protein